MAKYTIEELIQLKPSETLTVTSFDHVEFRSIIEKVKELQKLKEEEFLTHHGRRRSSHHHMKPKVKHNKPKVKTDADGWSTLEPAAPSTSGDEEATAAPAAKSSVTQETVRVKPNNKNISSSRPADTNDIIADKQVHGFNAFAALEDEESD